jgi:hypothetical protein
MPVTDQTCNRRAGFHTCPLNPWANPGENRISPYVLFGSKYQSMVTEQWFMKGSI